MDKINKESGEQICEKKKHTKSTNIESKKKTIYFRNRQSRINVHLKEVPSYSSIEQY